MAPDIRNVNRGRCQSCECCSNFISMSGLVLCDYCGCPPAKHLKLSPLVESATSKVGIASSNAENTSSNVERTTSNVEETSFVGGNVSDGDLADCDVSDSEFPKIDRKKAKGYLLFIYYWMLLDGSWLFKCF